MTLSTNVDRYRQGFEPRLVPLVRRVVGRVPALDDRLTRAGMPDGPDTLDDLDRLPVLSKDALPALQAARPFGGLLADGAEVVRAFASPGPIYEPQLAGPDPWRWGPALAACGIGPGDVVLNCFSYHLSPAGMMFDEACRAAGARVIPAGVGMAEVQAQVIADLGVTAYIGLPSYLGSLIKAYDDAGLPAQRWQVRAALVTAEPLPPDLRSALEARVPRVRMAYGTAEAGMVGYEKEPDGGLCLGEGAYVQLCDPATGAPVSPDEPGEVVVSVLHADYPLLRFGTGDVSRWLAVGDELRLAGVLGRVGAAVKVRGMFVHPHQAAQVLVALGEHGVAEGAFVVDQENGTDVLHLDLVPADGADRDRLVRTAEQRSRDTLRVRPQVRLVDSLDADSVLLDRRDLGPGGGTAS